jgi:hypothetical protein
LNQRNRAAAWWNLRNKESSAGECSWHDVNRVLEQIREMIADDAEGWGAGIILVGLAWPPLAA